MALSAEVRELRRLEDEALLLRGREWALAEALRSWDEDAAKRTGIHDARGTTTGSAAAALQDVEQRAVRSVARRQVLDEHAEHKLQQLDKVRSAVQELRKKNAELASKVQDAMEPVYAWADRVQRREEVIVSVDAEGEVNSLCRHMSAREDECVAVHNDVARHRQTADHTLAEVEREERECAEQLNAQAAARSAEETRLRREWRIERSELLKSIEKIEVRWQEKRFHVNRGSHFKQAKNGLQPKVPEGEKLDPTGPVSPWVQDTRAREQRETMEVRLFNASVEGSALRREAMKLEKKKREEQTRAEEEVREAQDEAERLRGVADQRTRERETLREQRDQLFVAVLEEAQQRGVALTSLSDRAPAFTHTSSNAWTALCRSVVLNGAPPSRVPGGRLSTRISDGTPRRRPPTAPSTGTPRRAITSASPKPPTRRGTSVGSGRAEAAGPGTPRSVDVRTPRTTPRRARGSAPATPKSAQRKAAAADGAAPKKKPRPPSRSPGPARRRAEKSRPEGARATTPSRAGRKLAPKTE